jgi:N-acetylneuraminic acid mutarotase
MKRRWTIALTAVAALASLLWLSGLAGALPLATPLRSEPDAGAPHVVSYQGQVTLGGTPYDGTGYFKFAVVDAAGTTSFWSNNGTSSGGGEPTKAVPLPVSNGLFHVLLGDKSLTNMTKAVTAATFDGTERYLRVWFSSDNAGFDLLTPDRRIAAVPYALQAEQASYALQAEEAGNGVPAQAMVLGLTDSETTLLDAGFSYTGLQVPSEGWLVRADMPTGRQALAAAAADGVIYALGGTSAASTWDTVNEAYDPATDSWTTKAAMPTGRRYLAAAAVDGIVYAIGGNSQSVYAETANEAYNPATNSWTTKTAMPTGRTDLAAVAAGGLIYALGGSQGEYNYQNVNEVYNPSTNSWASGTAMPRGRRLFAAAAVDGIIYAIGGDSAVTLREPLVDAYDPGTSGWATVTSLPTPRAILAAAAVDGVIYTLGGWATVESCLPTNEAYDPAANTWSEKPSMPTGRQELAAVAVNGVLYAIGGQAPGIFSTANEAYVPKLHVYRKD